MPILLDLFLTFAKIGAFTFGGGYAMLSVISDACVDKKKLTTDESAVPNRTSTNTSKTKNKASAKLIYQPLTATKTNESAVAAKQTKRVEIRVAI